MNCESCFVLQYICVFCHYSILLHCFLVWAESKSINKPTNKHALIVIRKIFNIDRQKLHFCEFTFQSLSCFVSVDSSGSQLYATFLKWFPPSVRLCSSKKMHVELLRKNNIVRIFFDKFYYIILYLPSHLLSSDIYPPGNI